VNKRIGVRLNNKGSSLILSNKEPKNIFRALSVFEGHVSNMVDGEQWISLPGKKLMKTK